MKRKTMLLAAIPAFLVIISIFWKLTRSKPETLPLPPQEFVENGDNKGNRDATGRSHPRIQDEQSIREKCADFAKSMNVPIDFYGRVVDLDDNPLPGVTISFQISEIPSQPVPWGPDHHTKGTCKTDSAGLFSIHEKSGYHLTIYSLAKPGYREPGWQNGSLSYEPNSPERHSPDANRPMDFTLIRDDLPKAAKVFYKRLRFAWNRGPVKMDLGPEIGQIDFNPSRTRDEPNNSRASFDWTVDVHAHGFGFAAINEHLWLAPRDGFISKRVYHFPRNASNWVSRTADNYAILTKDHIYGRMHLEIYGDGDEDSSSLYVTIYLNKSGARNIDH